MKTTDWLLPWRARKRILFLETVIPKDSQNLQDQLEKEKRDHAQTQSKLSALDSEHQKIKVATAALATWIRTVHKLDEVQPSKEPRNILR